MSASERLKALEARSAVGPWTYYEDSDVVDGGDVALLLDEDPELSRLIVALRNALPQIVAVVEAAEAMHEWLYNERTSDEPPRALLDKGFVSMIDSPTYERDEEMDDKLAAALTALEEALS